MHPAEYTEAALSGKSDVIGAAGEEDRRRRWIAASVAMRITGHKTSETLRKAARVYGKFEVQKHPGTGELRYDLDGCLGYAGATEADFADLLSESAV